MSNFLWELVRILSEVWGRGEEKKTKKKKQYTPLILVSQKVHKTTSKLVFSLTVCDSPRIDLMCQGA